MSSSPEKYFIFGKGKKGNEGGGREIFPKGYPKVNGKATETNGIGTFMMVDGENSSPARYIEDKRTWIPFDVSSPTKSKINKEPSYNEILIMFAELYYGGKWNPETAQIEVTSETKKYQQKTPLAFGEYLSLFVNMEYMKHLLDKGTQKARIKIDPKTGLAKKFGVAGFGEDMYGRYKRVMLAYEKPDAENIKKGIKSIVGKGLSQAELQALAKKGKKTFDAQETASMSAEAKWRRNFYDQPYIKDWLKNMKGKKETARNFMTYLARVFLITNYLDPKRFKELTEGAYELPEDERVKKLKKIVAIWKKWNSQFETDQEFYETPWIDPKYDDEEELSFPDGIWKALEDFSERDRKGGLERNYDGITKAEGARKSAADALVAFTMYAPSGKWKPDDQPPKTLLSRKIADPAYKDHGGKIDDKMVVEALKFLETGKVHHWSQKKHNDKLVFKMLTKYNEQTQENEDEFEPVMDLFPDEKQVPHFNPTLKEYQIYGTPFGKTKPASMLFRLSILCGWRKTEALTATTRPRTESTLTKLANFEHDEKPSGLEIDREDGLLSIAFLTRKTKKRGAEGAYFTAVIPPFSTKVMDSRDTIAMVCEKAGLGKWSMGSEHYYKYKDVKHEDKKTKKITTYHVEEENDKWIPQIIKFNSDELAQLFPEKTIKTRTETIKLKKGVPSDWLIGENGQFFKQTSLAPSGKMIGTYDLPDGTGKYGVDNKEETQMVRAYLDFPLRECYAVMSGTSVTKMDDDAVVDQAKEDNAYYQMHNKDHKVFTMLDGWSQVCDVGCPDQDQGELKKGKYSEERMDQDFEKYQTEDQDYWLSRTIHSLRHLFAQLWLRKSKWNFGVVAGRGHWETLDTLKKHYGGVPKPALAGIMTDVFSSDQDGENKMDQAINRSIALRNSQGGYSNKIANVQTKEDIIPDVSMPEKEKETKKLDKEIADV